MRCPLRTSQARSPDVEPAVGAGRAAIGFAVGIVCFVAILLVFGVREIAATLAVAGSGLLLVAAYHVVPLVADALGWWVLLDRRERPSVLVAVRARWVGEAVNSLLPVMQIGGAVVRAQVLARAGLDATLAWASVAVSVTVLVATQVVFTCLGLAVLLVHVGGGDLGIVVAVGTAVMALAVAAFVVVQRRGLFAGLGGGVERLLGRRDAWRVAERGAAIDARVRELYSDRRKLAASGAWHLAGWILGAGETWLALRFLGHPIDWTTAITIESLGEAVRTVSFPVPAGLGVQEGGFVLIGGLFGLTPGVSVALSLAKRVRELALGVPGLVVWQLESAASAVASRRAKAGEPPVP